MTYCDAHFHIVQCNSYVSTDKENSFFACTCAHSPEEFTAQETLVHQIVDEEANIMQAVGSNYSKSAKRTLYTSFGIHPQLCTVDISEHGAHGNQPSIELYASFMEQLIKEKRICAIGEAGFDLFTDEYAAQKTWQEEAWHAQCELAVKYQLPLIVHNRKALDEMFRDSALLSKMKCVLFHSFAFGPREAQSLVDHNINAYFSFGKQILNGNKKSIACVKELPIERLLLETDAPFQTLKGENVTKPEEIVRVYEAAAKIRMSDEKEMAVELERNFLNVYANK